MLKVDETLNEALQKKSITKALSFEDSESFIRVLWRLGLLSSASSYVRAGISAGDDEEEKVGGRGLMAGRWWKEIMEEEAETEAM